MDSGPICEYCGRTIVRPSTTKIIRGRKHLFCTEFCFRLYFYEVPKISYGDLREMYALRCVTVRPPEFRELIVE